MIEKLYEYALKNAGNKVEITQVQSIQEGKVKFFGIIDLLRQKEPMAVYEIGDKVFYNNYDDVIYTINENKNVVEDLSAYDEDEDYINTSLLEDGYQLIDSLLLERAKIRKPGLTTGGDIRKSQQRAEIMNGTKDRQNFEKKVERLANQAGVANPLVPQPQQESVNIEDANELSESLIDKENIEIIYEPMDWVIIKENGMKAQVTNVYNDGDGNLKMLTIVASNGVCYDADPDEIEPDPIYLANLPGVTVNSTLLGVPRLATFDINPETRLTDKVNNDDPALEEKYKDFND